MTDVREGQRTVAGSYALLRSVADGWLSRKRVPPEDRNDLIQEVWEDIVARPELIAAARIPRAAIHTIVHRRYVDYVRRRRRNPQVLLDSLPSVAPILSRTASSKIGWKRLVARCREGLPDETSRRILTLLYEKGMLPAEIANVLRAEGLRNKQGGTFNANTVSQKIRREILPALAELTRSAARPAVR
jgi:DNA-directed RNA polymerase specialized sigma24 family protein